jgi:peroxiredoxin
MLFVAAFSFAAEPVKGETIPDFSVLAIDNETELDREGLMKAAKKAGAKRIVLSFFATWCVNCKEEFALLKKHKGELGKNKVQVYLIDVGESIRKLGGKVGEFVKQNAGDSFPLYFDPNANMLRKLGFVESGQAKFELPVIVVLDEDLKVLAVFREAGKDFPQILWSEL